MLPPEERERHSRRRADIAAALLADALMRHPALSERDARAQIARALFAIWELELIEQLFRHVTGRSPEEA